ncbi:MAG: hypothetical protein ACOYXC_12580 [Candidatus Rifleibacteriota bacterium]
MSKRLLSAAFILFLCLPVAGAEETVATSGVAIEALSESAVASAAEEISESEEPADEGSSENSEALAPVEPEKALINPWAGGEEAELARLLPLNWLLHDKVAQKRRVGLAISLTGKSSRVLRSETELLLRDPGFCNMYSGLCVLPRLLQSHIRSSVSLTRILMARLAKDQISTIEALVALEIELESGRKALAVAENFLTGLNRQLEDYQTLIDRRTRLSELHNAIRSHSRELMAMILAQIARFQTICAQHRLILDGAAVQTSYLHQISTESRVRFATRMARVVTLLDDSQNKLEDYHHQLVFFAVKIKEAVSAHLEEIEKMAMAVDKNRFHIVLAAEKEFPERDLNPQQTGKFSLKEHLGVIFSLLQQQFKHKAANNPDKENEVSFEDEYMRIMLALDGDFSQFSSYSELFDRIYNPEKHLEKPEKPESQETGSSDEAEEDIAETDESESK